MPAKFDTNQLVKVFMDATDAIIIEDLEGTVIDLNRAAEAAYGWSRDELIGHSIKRIIPEVRHGHADELLEQCIAGHDVTDLEVVRVTKSGDRLDVLLTLSRLNDDNGEAFAVATYAKDISRLKQESAERDRMVTVFMDATDAIIIEDLEGTVVDLNRAAEAAYGWSREELIGQPIKKIIPEYRHESAEEMLEQCIKGEEVRDVEVVRISKEGTTYIILLTLSLLHDHDGKPKYVATYAKDISELRRIEEEQRQEREEIIAAQAQSLVELSTPVTEIWEGVLLLPVVGIVDSRRAHDIMKSVLEAIAKKQARQMILDISGVAVVDTAVANHFIKITRATQMMGCKCSISGVSPSIAQTIVDLGIDVGSVRTVATMKDALISAFREVGLQVGIRS